MLALREGVGVWASCGGSRTTLALRCAAGDDAIFSSLSSFSSILLSCLLCSFTLSLTAVRAEALMTASFKAGVAW